MINFKNEHGGLSFFLHINFDKIIIIFELNEF